MRIEQLQYLLETAKVDSINKASQRLHITQQSLNTALTKLEGELDTTLFERSPAGVTLTHEGELVAAYAQETLQKLEELKQMLSNGKQDQDDLRGHLELSAAPALNHGLLPAALKYMRQKHKKVTISLVERENLEMLTALLNNEPRLYLMSVGAENDRILAMLDLNNLFFRSLDKSKTQACVSTQHPLARQKTVTLHSLSKYPLAIFQASEKEPNLLLDYLEAAGRIQIVLTTNNLTVYQQAIDEGEVVGFAPQYSNKMLKRARTGTVFIPIKDMPKSELICLADKKYYQKNSRIIDCFLQCIYAQVNGENS